MSQISHKHCGCSSYSSSWSSTCNFARTLLRFFAVERQHIVWLVVCASLLQQVLAAQAFGINDERFVYSKSKADANSADATAADTDTNVKLLGENETDPFPMDFYRELNNITDISEFIEKFVDPDSIDPKLGIHENLRRNVERASVVRAKAARCSPEPTVVDLIPLSTMYSYFPKCTRVKRCSGCCNTPLLSCQPTKTEIVNYQVTRYSPTAHGIKSNGFDVIPVEQHLECKCDCRVKAKDCNAFQIYEDCQCHCPNTDAQDKCHELEHKEWDGNSCRCVCRHRETCTTGTYYDENQCKCLLLSTDADSDAAFTTPTALADRRRFIVKAIPVEDDNSTIYEV
ncbi:uncharacterized protein LOC106088750 isoform X2 [Stomoxys calcitrans]|uniref:uncharacterized protein LOC106088750 isoform X2 n=1 Tax=Stomoxys calcitrans TaxID=35570 RepID=UPI0027E2243F|nr:uncharacterized protein LOC106088750 isoform X2 [Stomoxys calcitrans]